MSKTSNKQLKTKIKLQNQKKNDRVWLNQRSQPLKVRQWAAEEFYGYISHDFLYNLFYMMIHKKYICYWGMDYHRITKIIDLFQNVYSKNLRESVHELFGWIDDEDEVKLHIEKYRWNMRREANNYIVTVNEEGDDYYNPNSEKDTKEYILPCYMLKNFLQFKQLFYDVVSNKYNVGADTDFWRYACRYLLMEDKKYQSFYQLGPDGKNFPYKLIEK